MKLVSLKVVCEVFADGDWIESKDQSDGGIRLIQTGNVGVGVFKDRIEKARWISEDTFKKLRCTEILEGDVLVSRLPDPVGRSCLIPALEHKAITAVDCSILRFDPKIMIAKYFVFYSQSSRYSNEIEPLISGSTRQRISREKLGTIQIPTPSLDEQLRIVAKLETAFAEIDLLEDIHTRSNKELLDNLFGTYRDSLLTSACADSPEVEFGEIGNFVRGPFGGSLKKSIFKPSGIAVYEQQHAIYDNFESFRYFIDDLKYQEMKRFEVKTNDLIMSCSGTYGKIAVVPEGSPKGIINQALLKITPDKGVRSQFIKHWMQSSLFQVELEKDIGGAALQNVPSVAKMKSIKIRLPEEIIQIEAIEKLDEVQAEINQAKTTQENIRNNYFALRQSLLSSAFTQEDMVA